MPKIRGFNYTEREKQELLHIIKRYKSVIENKKTDQTTLNEKKEIWNKISIEYNSRVERPRELEQLKGCYSNLKRHTKQQIANERAKDYLKEKENDGNTVNVKEVYENIKAEALVHKRYDKMESLKTGGGTFVQKTSNLDEQVLGICEDQFNPLPNIYDDASKYFKDGEYYIIEADSFIDENNDEPDITENNEVILLKIIE